LVPGEIIKRVVKGRYELPGVLLLNSLTGVQQRTEQKTRTLERLLEND